MRLMRDSLFTFKENAEHYITFENTVSMTRRQECSNFGVMFIFADSSFFGTVPECDAATYER